MSFGHFDLFKTTQGKLVTNLNFRGNFSCEIEFNSKNVHYLQEVGISYLNVGNDDISNIRIAIYEKTNLSSPILEKDSLFQSIYNQTVFLKTNIFLSGSKNYIIVIGSTDKNNDDIIHLFQPNILPVKNDDINCNINIINNDFSKIPSTPSLFYPFLSLGISTQSGIDFTAEQPLKGYLASKNQRYFITEFSTKAKSINLKSIQLKHLKLGLDRKSNIEVLVSDLQLGKDILKLDTLLLDSSKTNFDFQISTTLNSYSKYQVGYKLLDENDTDNIQFLYKPQVFPYFDNLDLIEINNFLINNNIDSLGVSYNLTLEEDLTPATIQKLTNNELYYYQDERYVYFKKNELISFDLYNVNGSKINIENKNENEMIIFDKQEIRTGLYIIKTTNRLTSASTLILVH